MKLRRKYVGMGRGGVKVGGWDCWIARAPVLLKNEDSTMDSIDENILIGGDCKLC